MALTGPRGNHDSDFTFGRVFFKVGYKGGGCIAEILLEGFGELACDANGALRADRIEGGECFEDTVRGFEVDAGLASCGGGLEFGGAAPAFDRQESAEKKPVAREARTHEGGEDGRWPREHADSESSLDTSADEPVAGVGDAGHSGIRDQSDMASACNAICDILAAEGFIVSVQAEEGFLYAEMLQKKPTVSRVLGGDEVGGPENLDGAKGDILPIADGRGNDA